MSLALRRLRLPSLSRPSLGHDALAGAVRGRLCAVFGGIYMLRAQTLQPVLSRDGSLCAVQSGDRTLETTTFITCAPPEPPNLLAERLVAVTSALPLGVDLEDAAAVLLTFPASLVGHEWPCRCHILAKGSGMMAETTCACVRACACSLCRAKGRKAVVAALGQRLWVGAAAVWLADVVQLTTQGCGARWREELHRLLELLYVPEPDGSRHAALLSVHTFRMPMQAGAGSGPRTGWTADHACAGMYYLRYGLPLFSNERWEVRHAEAVARWWSWVRQGHRGGWPQCG